MSQRLLYLLVPDSNVSPFDATIAADAGYNQIFPMTGIGKNDVTGVVQDAIFARPPASFNETGIFLGGRDVHLATDMFRIACKAMVKPFEASVFADPNGAYTTSASIVALVEQALRERGGEALQGQDVAVLGAGPVGLCTAVLMARQGANTTLGKLTAADDRDYSERFFQRYEVDVKWKNALTLRDRIKTINSASVLICAARAGIRILEKDALEKAENLVVAADANAVPPAGIESIELNHKYERVKSGEAYFSSIGPLAIGNVKYRTQFGMFEEMQKAKEALYLDFIDAYDFARSELTALEVKQDAAA